MPKFKIHYTFIGQGDVIIKAKNIKQAEDNFYYGDDWLNDESEENQFEIENIIKL